MLRVTVEQESPHTGETTLLGQMTISNVGGSHDRGNYRVAVARRGVGKTGHAFPPRNPARTGEVHNYPRLSYSVWRLVIRALKSAFPEEA